MDAVHALAAEGAPSGTLVLADRQLAGRGRGGRRWAASDGAGAWFTLLERDVGAEALSLLSLRVGLAVARAVAPWVSGTTCLKWPNDVLVATGDPVVSPREQPWSSVRKLAGVLVEVRWRDGVPEWVAIGVGINLRVPDDAGLVDRAAALVPGVSRARLLTDLVPGLRAAARQDVPLSAAELQAWDACDAMRGRACREPGQGIVAGIGADGALRILPHASGGENGSGEDGRGTLSYRSGSLILDEEEGAC